jgi:hypothetical protein
MKNLKNFSANKEEVTMKNANPKPRLLALLAAAVIILSFSAPALAVDDGARAYWKGREGTSVMSFQYLNLNLQASGTQQFAPGQYIYANADTEANIFIGSWARHITLFKRPSSIAVNIVGGSVNVDVGATAPGQFTPPGVTPATAFSESASGYADPALMFDINLFGTPRLKSGVDLLNYEPTFTVDAAFMVAFPIGTYDEDKLVNMGLNRWYGRIALPMKYHFGVFSPGYMSSFELIPSVWLFDENDDFLGQDMENDPMFQLEAHLTHDFTPAFFGSVDLLYRNGFGSEIDGVDVGDDIDIGNLGFSLNFQVTDNVTIRTGFSSNVFGDSDLDNSMIRMQFIYAWHPASENMKKLMQGH